MTESERTAQKIAICGVIAYAAGVIISKEVKNAKRRRKTLAATEQFFESIGDHLAVENKRTQQIIVDRMFAQIIKSNYNK